MREELVFLYWNFVCHQNISWLFTATQPFCSNIIIFWWTETYTKIPTSNQVGTRCMNSKGLVWEGLGNSFTSIQNLILKKGTELGGKKKEKKGEPLGFELQNSLKCTLPLCNSPTNCQMAICWNHHDFLAFYSTSCRESWNYSPDNVGQGPFVLYHLVLAFQPYSSRETQQSLIPPSHRWWITWLNP